MVLTSLKNEGVRSPVILDEEEVTHTDSVQNTEISGTSRTILMLKAFWVELNFSDNESWW